MSEPIDANYEMLVMSHYFHHYNIKIECLGNSTSTFHCDPENGEIYEGYTEWQKTSDALSINSYKISEAWEKAKKIKNKIELKKVEFNFISRFYKSAPFNFGVEIEFFTDEYTPTSVIDDLLFQTNIKKWEIKTDSSCGRRKDESGLELVSPILEGEDGFNQIKEAVKFIKGLGGKINNHCGLHIHIGIENFTPVRVLHIAKRYKANEKNIDTFMAMSRRNDNNVFCKPMSDAFWSLEKLNDEDVESISDIVSKQSNRQCKFNLYSYREHGTIEFRHHGATLNSKRIIYWVKFLQEFCKFTTSENIGDSGFDKMFHSKDVKKYYQTKRNGLASREEAFNHYGCYGYSYRGNWQ